MSNFITKIDNLLNAGKDIVLTTIVDNQGSTPRTTGSKMIVLPNGKIIDTIGGGLVEDRVIKTAVTLFETKKFILNEYNLNAKDADSMDMICGGRLSVALEFIEATAENKALFRKAAQLIHDKKCFSFITAFPDAESGEPQITRHAVILPDQPGAGDATLPQSFMDHLKILDNRSATLVPFENRHYLVEPFFAKETVYIFGGGHISKQLAALTHMIDFHTVVLDDRKEYANNSRFRTAETRVVPGFENAFEHLNINRGSYIIIVTRGHIHDRTVLREAIKTDARYIGMIGSRRKRDAIYKSLMDEGVAIEALEKVYSPIGLDINSETPQEIAISIIAELISVRRGQDES